MNQATPTNRTPNNASRVFEGGDESLGVEFYRNAVTDKDHVRIWIPGDKWFQPDYEATEQYQNRFSQQWAAYLAGQEQTAGQTRIEDVTWLDEAMRNALKHVQVHTVEQLANVQDGLLGELGMGARKLRDRARTHVETAEKAQAFDSQNAEIEAMRAEMAEMRRAMAKPKRARTPRKPKPPVTAVETAEHAL